MKFSSTERLALYRELVRAREFEKGVVEAHPYFHSVIGEEAVTVGTSCGLLSTDVYVAHYRGALAANVIRGASMHKLIAGVFGKVTAYDRGRSFAEVRGRAEPNNYGTLSGYLATSICHATGAALSAKLRKTDQVVVVVFGDGCANKGEFHEAANLAGVLTLPVVYVCQNNQFCISVPGSKGTAGRIADRAAGYGFPGLQVDGNDVEAVHGAVKDAVARARAGSGPSLIEALTYRVSGHWATDPAPYQSEADKRHWLERDPVELFEARLCKDGLITQEQILAIHNQAAAEVQVAITQAKEDPVPTAEEMRPELLFAQSGR